jgi:N-acetylmuramoyl-L-alanine amidase
MTTMRAAVILLWLAACADARSDDPSRAASGPAVPSLATAVGPTAPSPTAPPGPDAAPVWPAPGAPLARVSVATRHPARVVIDAGHGAPDNLGNTSVRCEREADFTRRAQDAVLARLAGLPGLTLLAGRPSAALVAYRARVRTFEQWRADAVISLHSDTRAGDGWTVSSATGCWEGRGAAGFSVLYSDEGTPDRVDRRRRLARAVARRMIEAGFPAYGGADYPGLYAPDPEQAGAFVDRHAPGKRILMLHVPTVPVVIVETHEAVDPDEVARWDEPATLDAFAAAVDAAVQDVVAGG